MTEKTIHRGQAVSGDAAQPARKAGFARLALLTSGAVSGLAASTLAGFGLVGLLFPHAGLPGTGGAAVTAAAYTRAPATAPAVEVARLAPTPLYRPVPMPVHRPQPAVTTAAPAADAGAVPDATAAAPAAAPDATADATPTSAPAGSPVRMVLANPDRMALPPHKTARFTAPEFPELSAQDLTVPAPETAQTIVAQPVFDSQPVDVPPVSGPLSASPPPFEDLEAMMATNARGIAPAPENRSESSAQPQVFAALARSDAGIRDSASLLAAPEPPAEPGAATGMAAPPRPAPRPEGLAERIASATEPATTTATATTAAPLRSIRPNRRPAHMEQIVLASVGPATPAPQAATDPAPAAEAEAEAPAGIVEVASRSGGSGLFSGGDTGCGRSLARAMPARRGGATGSAFFAALAGVSGPERDTRAIAELAHGNMPDFLRDLQPVVFKGRDDRGQETEIVICVTPDYLALGSDTDFVRVPLGLPAAAHIAGAFDMTLPTPRMVDAIYAQAGVKLSPAPMTPGAQMSSTSYFVTHNATIEGQLRGRRGLTAGHKKDVVMAARMASAPGRVAIYGWHRSNGAPIQPVSTVHGANYADYSHGIRLVSKTAYLNGRAVALGDLLASSRYAHLLNKEGPMPGPVIRIASR
ncbi:MAG: hypothetical protein CSA74_08750 [Rhodobacterales bacterium]|nr:MAG: hypothetical protein CSA74_08750 [Rhodobacterales bacterium]